MRSDVPCHCRFTLFWAVVPLVVGGMFLLPHARVHWELPAQIANLPAKGDRPKVVVFKRKMPADIHLIKEDVEIREVKDEELDTYIRFRHTYMPAVPAAVDMRELACDVEAGVPILKAHFKGFICFPTYSEFAVVDVTAEEAAAVPPGDFADVLLTAEVFNELGEPETRTVLIATAVKRRDFFGITRPWDRPEPPNRIWLKANAYRGTLINFAKTRGRIAIVPTEVASPLARRWWHNGEGANEQARIAEMHAGRKISDADLEALLGALLAER